MIAGVVGKKKQGDNKFILWEYEAGMLLNDQCTWQQGEHELVPSVLLNKPTTSKLGQASRSGTITKQHQSNLGSYYAKFTSRRCSVRWVDLELPQQVSKGEHSYWRLDGYETWEGETEDDIEAI